MCQFIESIRYLNEEMPLLQWHEQRFAGTQFHAFGQLIYPSLLDIIQMTMPQKLSTNITYKCRICYNAEEISVDFLPYQKKRIHHLTLVQNDEIEYYFKSADRRELDFLKKGMDTNSEVLIVKNGLLTDTSFTNIALLRNNEWLTPQKPLLEGVQRAELIAKKRIIPTEISAEDLSQFSKIRLFNAMVGWENAWEIKMNNIG